jgi:hypothetical protein
MRILALDLDGLCCGPLFAPSAKRRPPKPRMQSTHRDRVLRARVPAWADRGLMREIYRVRATLSRQTGVRYSVDHVVPVNHPLVCGLHVHNNLEVLPLDVNVRKSNNWWPDMWGEQLELPL